MVLISNFRNFQVLLLWLARVEKLIINRNTEDALLMHYLDHVFHVQYPFYNASKRAGRGWLFSIIRQARSAYHASLALSEYHQHLKLLQQTRNSNSPNILKAKGSHYDLAVQKMHVSLKQSQPWSRIQDFTQGIETLTCILQLLFWEVRLSLPGLVFNANNVPKRCLVVAGKIGEGTLVQLLPWFHPW
jgi:hypothetical protein